MTTATRQADPVLAAKADQLLHLLKRDCRLRCFDLDTYEEFRLRGLTRGEIHRALNLLARDGQVRIGTRWGHTRVELLEEGQQE